MKSLSSPKSAKLKLNGANRMVIMLYNCAQNMTLVIFVYDI
jgi:hypothetical protein